VRFHVRSPRKLRLREESLHLTRGDLLEPASLDYALQQSRRRSIDAAHGPRPPSNH